MANKSFLTFLVSEPPELGQQRFRSSRDQGRASGRQIVRTRVSSPDDADAAEPGAPPVAGKVPFHRSLPTTARTNRWRAVGAVGISLDAVVFVADTVGPSAEHVARVERCPDPGRKLFDASSPAPASTDATTSADGASASASAPTTAAPTTAAPTAAAATTSTAASSICSAASDVSVSEVRKVLDNPN